MSARNWQLRIDDILESIQHILDYTEGMDFSTWSGDQKTIDAVVRNFEIIGEAASHIPPEIQSRFPDIPWTQMKGIRNILAHEYFGVDKEVIWETIQNDLPALQEKIRNLF